MPVGASPCVNICTMDDEAGICIGCGRTITEIAQWLSLSTDEREEIKKNCAARLSQSQPAERIAG